MSRKQPLSFYTIITIADRKDVRKHLYTLKKPNIHNYLKKTFNN